MDKKIKFSLGLLILVLISLAVELFFYQRIKKQALIEKPTVTQEISPAPKKLTNLEIAKKVLDCLDKTMRDERGVYATGKECSSLGDCNITGESNRAGLYVLWGRTKYIERTGNQKEKEILMKDINFYLDNGKVFVIQPDFRSKIFLYQMWHSKIFSKEEKQKVDELVKKVYPGKLKNLADILDSIDKEDSQDSNFNKFIENPKVLLLDQTKNKVTMDDFRRDVMFSSDYFFQYLWEGNERDLKVAKKLLYNSLGEYQIFKDDLALDHKYLLALVFAEFYNNLQEKVFLDISLSLFGGEKMGENCWLVGSCPKSVFSLVIYSMLVQELYRSERRENYSDLNRGIIDFLIDNNFDGQGYRGYELGDGCFFAGGGLDKKLRLTAENGLIVGVLSGE